MSHKNPTKPRLSENNHIKTKNNCNKWLLIEIKVVLLVNTETIKDMTIQNTTRKTVGELKRNDVFRFVGKNTEYRVVMFQTKFILNIEVATKMKVQSQTTLKYRTFDLEKQYNYGGSFCTMFDREVEVIQFGE